MVSRESNKAPGRNLVIETLFVHLELCCLPSLPCSSRPRPLQSAPQADSDEAAAAEVAARIASGPGFWTDWLAELDRQGLLEACSPTA